MRKACDRLALLLVPALSAAPGPPVTTAPIPAGPVNDPIRKLLVIGVDGLRPDAMEAARAPNMHQLIAEGCYSDDAQCEDLTFSGPNWATILHGVHRDKHNITTNEYGSSRLALYPDFLEYLEWFDPTLNTARVTTWDRLSVRQPTGADIRISHHNTGGDARGAADAVRLISGTHPGHAADIDAMFVYFADVDHAGHAHGFSPTSAGYLAEIAETDARIGDVLNAIRARRTYAIEDWLIILTSDHGGAPDGSHHGNTPEKRRVPFIVSGSSAVRGAPFPQPKVVDVCKTALAFMGAPIPVELDGHVVGLEATAPPVAALGVNLLFNGDAEYDRGFSDNPPDQHISGWDDPGPDQVSSISYGAPNYPGLRSNGPTDRGLNFFSGGRAPVSMLTQTVDLGPLSGRLDTGELRYSLSGWLGGSGSDYDDARVRVRFKDRAGTVLAEGGVGPVGPLQRAKTTGLAYRAAHGVVPPGARSVEVALICTRVDGAFNDGYADNLSLIISDADMHAP